MPRTFRLIDGYNLLHAAGIARERYGPGELEKCRERLLRLLATRLTDDERSRTTIVFDARDSPGIGPSVLVRDGLRIEFARPASDADERIEELISEHPAPKQLTVVSSDRRLQAAIRRRRGRPQRSEEFAAELDQRPRRDTTEDKSAANDGKTGGEIAASEIAHWENVFADAVEELEAERRSAQQAAKSRRRRK